MSRVEPPISDTTAPFWDATRGRRFLLQWCTACEAPVFYPRDNCPRCLGTALDWREASGRGTVYAVSVQHRPANPTMADRVPYTVALVDLEEGVRIMSNVIGSDPEAVAVGLPVALDWEPLSDGRHLPQFRPATEEE